MKTYKIELTCEELLMVCYALDKESEQRQNKSELQSDEIQKQIYLETSKSFANVSRKVTQQWN